MQKRLFNTDIIYLKAQSLVKNIDQIVSSLVCFHPKMILVSEARATNDIEDEIQIDNYSIVRNDSLSTHWGLVIYRRA